MARMTASKMVTKLQKQAHAAELKSIKAKHRLAVQHLKEDLSATEKHLQAEMKREVTQIRDAMPRRVGRPPVIGRPPATPKKKRGRPPVKRAARSRADADVLKLLAQAKRKS